MTQLCTCGRPTAGAWLCDHCVTTFGYAIANVGAHYADLETVATKQARSGTHIATKGSSGRAQPLPVDMRFVNGARVRSIFGGVGGSATAPGNQVRWDTWNTVVAWCRTIMEDQPELAGPVCTECLHLSCAAIRRRRWPANTVPSMIRYLARQFRWLLGERWAPVMLDEFLDLEQRLVRFVDVKPNRWYAGKCSATTRVGEADVCCTAELYADADSGAITCRACGTRHDVSERREFLLREAKGYLVTATEAASALLAWTDYDGSENKLVDRVRKWREHGRIESRGVLEVAGCTRHLYRLGDIQQRMVDDAQRKQTRRIGGVA